MVCTVRGDGAGGQGHKGDATKDLGTSVHQSTSRASRSGPPSPSERRSTSGRRAVPGLDGKRWELTCKICSMRVAERLPVSARRRR